MDLAVSSLSPQITGLPATDGSHSQTDAFFAEWSRPGLSSLIPDLTLGDVSGPPNESSPLAALADTPTAVDDLRGIEPSVFGPGAASI